MDENDFCNRMVDMLINESIIIDTKIDYFQLNVNNRVTLMLDMTPADRCYFNSPEGKKLIEDIEMLTQCNLQIMRNDGDVFDSSPMSITGQDLNVLDAYRRLMSAVPLTICFKLQCNSHIPIYLDSTTPEIYAIRKKYDMIINFGPEIDPMAFSSRGYLNGGSIIVYVRNKNRNQEQLHDGLNELLKYIKDNNIGTVSEFIQTQVDIPSSRDILGRNGSFVGTIERRTSTQIVSNRNALTPVTTVIISGIDLNAICLARQEIVARTQVELHFELGKAQIELMDHQQMGSLGEEFGVNILCKPSVSPFHKTMMIRGKQMDTPRLFEVRKRILAHIFP